MIDKITCPNNHQDRFQVLPPTPSRPVQLIIDGEGNFAGPVEPPKKLPMLQCLTCQSIFPYEGGLKLPELKDYS